MYAKYGSPGVSSCWGTAESHTHTHTHTYTFFQTIFNNPPEGERSIIQGTYTQGFSKTSSISAMKIVISST